MFYLILATDPEEQKRLEVLKLKRRFIRDKSATSAYIAKIEAKRKIARQVSTLPWRAAGLACFEDSHAIS